MLMSARLKWVVVALIAVTISLKLLLQGNTASPPKAAQLQQLGERLAAAGYATAGIIGNDQQPEMILAKAGCVLMVSVIAPDGLNEVSQDSVMGANQKDAFAFSGRYFDQTPPRWEPIFGQSVYKLLHSMRVKTTYRPVYKIRMDKNCDISRDLAAATN